MNAKITTDIRPPATLATQPGSDGVQSVDAQAPIRNGNGSANRAEIDQTEQAPARLEAGPSSSVQQTRESAQLKVQLDQTRRSRGVRSKRMKTETIESMSRQARAAFRTVLDTIEELRPKLEIKPRRGASTGVQP